MQSSVPISALAQPLIFAELDPTQPQVFFLRYTLGEPCKSFNIMLSYFGPYT